MSKLHKEQASLIDKVQNNGEIHVPTLSKPGVAKQLVKTPVVSDNLSSNLRTFKSKYMRKMNDKNNLARLTANTSETNKRQSIEVHDMTSSNSPIVDVFLA